jgi:prevent-host-death family protein
MEPPMTVTTVTSHQFSRNVSGAKKAAQKGPVFITECGRPAHVLLTIDDYRRLTGEMSLAEALAQPGRAANFEFKPPRMDLIVRAADPG